MVVGYNPDILEKGSAYRVGLDKSGANHASLIVGRKFNEITGECDYILRNSWGKKDCENNYAENYKCDAYGNAYIRGRDLLYSADEVITIKKRPGARAAERLGTIVRPASIE